MASEARPPADAPSDSGSATNDPFSILPSHLGSKILERSLHRDQHAISVAREDAHSILEALKQLVPDLVLTDVTAIDYLGKDTRERFQILYVLQDRSSAVYFRVHAWVPEDDPEIESAFDLFGTAKWGERECHDMFGIVFRGNPDLRRLLMPQDYPGFPLLKDYPLKGRGERIQFPKVVPEGDHMDETTTTEYPVTIGRGLHTPEYLEALEENSRPSGSGDDETGGTK